MVAATVLMVTSPTTGHPPVSVKVLAPAHVEWLSLIRYQARQGDEQSRAPLPLSTLSINVMQDAVEALLNLIAEHNDIELRRRTVFDQLFDDVAARFPALAHHRAPLLALNTARVGFKHYGNEVRETTIERRRGDAMDFMVDATRVALGQDFESISMTAFVRDSQARGNVEAASTMWTSGDSIGALSQLRLGFDRLVRDYEMRKVWHQGKSLFSTEPTFRPSGLGNPFDDKSEAHIVKWIEAIDERQKLLALGVDLLRYVYFDAHAPGVTYVASGEALLHSTDTAPVGDEVFNRCYRFVIDTALRLGADDYDYDAHAIRLAREARERDA